MSGNESWIAIALCTAGLGAAAAWLCRGRAGRSAVGIDARDTADGSGRRRRRRRLGMGLMALISLATLIGTVALEPLPHALSFVGYWAVVVVLVLWLCCLAITDVFHTMTVQARWAAERSRRRDAALAELRARMRRGGRP